MAWSLILANLSKNLTHTSYISTLKMPTSYILHPSFNNFIPFPWKTTYLKEWMPLTKKEKYEQELKNQIPIVLFTPV